MEGADRREEIPSNALLAIARITRQAVAVTFGSLQITRVNETYIFTRTDADGNERAIGVSNDLKAFVENRVTSGMSSPELLASLQQLKECGEAHAWDHAAMKAAQG